MIRPQDCHTQSQPTPASSHERPRWSRVPSAIVLAVARDSSHGFTVIELLVLVLLLSLLASSVLPALARSRRSDHVLQCLNNHRQLLIAWKMYAADNSDALIYNLSLSGSSLNWANNVMDWSANGMNTNLSLLQKGPLAPYLGGQVTAYSCPADHYVSPPQQALGWSRRTRSVSMNSFFGPYTTNSAAPGPTANSFYPSYRQFLKLAQVPGPGRFFVTIDEHPDSINDGYFINDPRATSFWGDIPASNHQGACGLGFADGHSEMHAWLSSRTKTPIRFFYSSPALDPLGRTDYNWLAARTAALR